jgi:hypothetical protein
MASGKFDSCLTFLCRFIIIGACDKVKLRTHSHISQDLFQTRRVKRKLYACVMKPFFYHDDDSVTLVKIREG